MTPKLLAAVVLLFGVLSCRVPPPTTTTGRIISCTTQAVQQNWPSVLGPVNTCLASASVTACLLGLINPAVGITEDVIACVVRRSGADFAMAAQVNHGDVRSERAAENARAFLRERSYRFAE